jgi:hypothetical protein
MNHSGSSQALIAIAFMALIAWRMYGRIRRNIGRQTFKPVRPWITLVLFPVLTALLAYAARAMPLAQECLAGGIALGLALGVLGHRLTRFEATPEGMFYTPNAHIGIVLSAVLVARIAYRFMTNGFPGAASGAPPPSNPLTPLTLLIFGTLAGYYWAYAVGLLRWAFRVRSEAKNTASA